MRIPQHHRSVGGHHLFLGANLRLHDPRAEKYRLNRRLNAATADLTQERNLGQAWFNNGADYRTAQTDQQQLGSCTAFSVKECMEMSDLLDGKQPTPVSAGWVYEEERRLENGANWKQDVGAETADGLDIVIAKGCPSDALKPYTGQAETEYDNPAAEADAANQKYVVAHYPIEVKDPQVLQLAWTALDARMPVVLETAWPEDWFNPGQRGVVTATPDLAQIAGGHSIVIFGWIPDSGVPGGGLFAVANHWGAWNPGAVQYGHGMRAGDWLLPASVLTRPDSPCWTLISVARTPIDPQPDPNPQPQPQPATCRQAALALAQPVVDAFAAAHGRNPRATSSRYELAGAQAVVTALGTMPEVRE